MFNLFKIASILSLFCMVVDYAYKNRTTVPWQSAPRHGPDSKSVAHSNSTQRSSLIVNDKHGSEQRQPGGEEI
jgi:hypothetical protein